MSNIETLSAGANYTIYLKNESNDDKNFWCFLEKPDGISDYGAFANSAANLFVMSGYGGTNKFNIPAKFVIGAGASNNAVGLGVRIDSSVVNAVDLQQTWEAQYASIPPKQGPRLSLIQGQRSPNNTIGLLSNSFDKMNNENGGWFSNMSFGIETENGFIGVTWSPSPNNQNTITPKFAFYISTGSYSSSQLADFGTISNQAARIELSDFRNSEVTVTFTSRGQWIVQGGRVQ
jgi:hypothetical protein